MEGLVFDEYRILVLQDEHISRDLLDDDVSVGGI